VKVEIWSDVVCPWCYIGKRRLEQALSQFEHADEVEIFWRSFQLQPEARQDVAVPTLEYLKERFGPQAAQMTEHVAEVAKGDGLDLDFSKALTVNTFDAHRLLHLATDSAPRTRPRRGCCARTSPKALTSQTTTPWSP
jgi:predicted DsbA family dithiol-disulfide isomerase